MRRTYTSGSDSSLTDTSTVPKEGLDLSSVVTHEDIVSILDTNKAMMGMLKQFVGEFRASTSMKSHLSNILEERNIEKRMLEEFDVEHFEQFVDSKDYSDKIHSKMMCIAPFMARFK